jgi:hypothetical protein
MENLHLTRRWEHDQLTIESSLARAASDPGPLWFTLFPEGTVVCPETTEATVAYAVKAGLLDRPSRVLVSFGSHLFSLISQDPTNSRSQNLQVYSAQFRHFDRVSSTFLTLQ